MTTVIVKHTSKNAPAKTTSELLIESLKKNRTTILKSKRSAIAYLQRIGGVDKDGKVKVTPL